MKHFPQMIGILALSLILPTCAATSAQAGALVRVGRAVPTQTLLSQAQLVGHQSADAPVSAAITLPLRNQATLETMLTDVYTPGNPLYGQYMTPATFAAEFGPTKADYQAVVDYAKSEGLTVRTYTSRTVVGISAPSGAVEKAFHVTLNRYRVASGRIAYANTEAPQLPESVASRINGIVGLDSLLRPHPELVRRPSAAVMGPRLVGSDSSGGLTPNDIKSIYNLNGTNLEGEGQSLALVEGDGYDSGDINAYVTKYNLPVNPSILYNIYVDGFNGVPGAGQDEDVLDIDMMLALAPHASRIYVYEAPGFSSDILQIFTQVADDDYAESVSCSLGIPETFLEAGYSTSQYAALAAAQNQAFEQMALQGQSFFEAAGDNGAYDDGATISVDNPADQQYVTAVGGTTLDPINQGTPKIAYGTESAWGSTTETGPGYPLGSGGGGGYSSIVSKPFYQYRSFSTHDPYGPVGYSGGQGKTIAGLYVPVPANPMRDVPDVSLDADPDSGYAVYVGADETPGYYPNNFEVVGGTSAAAPLWAAFTALVDEARAANNVQIAPGDNPGTPTVPLGFINPLIYEIGYGIYGDYANDFHDIEDGSDNLVYLATAGYDDATGWGSFNGTNLLSAMAVFAPTGSTTGSGSSAGSGTGTGGTTIVTGTVTFDGSAPSSGVTATITATSTSGAQYTATTDSSGAYTLSVPSGLTYTLTATATGYLTQTISNQVFTASAVTVSFQLSNSLIANANSFPAGIEMISEPYDFSSTGDDFAQLFGLPSSIPAGGPQLFLWQPQMESYAQYPNPPADTLRPGVGYWLRVPSSDTSGLALKVQGTPVSTASPFLLSLQQGWNQIGDPYLSSVDLSNIAVALDSAGTNSTALPSASTMVSPILYSYPAGATNYNAVTSSLQPYLGYWIYAFQPCYLTFNPAP